LSSESDRTEKAASTLLSLKACGAKRRYEQREDRKKEERSEEDVFP